MCAHRSRPSRPVFLDLRAIRLPINAVVSILHRLSGLVLVVALPWLAILWVKSLSGPEAFLQVKTLLQGSAQFLWVSLLWALAHHFFAGLRHLAMDVHWGLGRESSRYTAWLVLFLDVISLPLIWGGLT